ncbi:MAG: cellulase family glycosylhydrolase [Deltaproteobacteria bacterium]|nr:cellulase family glycosylhydrolase [Deltaproteobacteria bacterium]
MSRLASFTAPLVLLALAGCGSSSDGSGSTSGSTSSSATSGTHGSTSGTTGGSTTAGSTSSSTGTHGSTTGSGSSSTTTTTGTSGSTGGTTGTYPAGWLYTSGAQILVADGNGGGSPWMGRGVNMDDLYLCGYDYTLWMTDPGQTLQNIASGLVSAWHPTFVRVSLGMNSYPTVSSWTSNLSSYQAPMTAVINQLGATPGVYVLVTLRSDASMIDGDTAAGAEPTLLPSDASNTPDATNFPNGTDDTYRAIVDTFANSKFVMFGIANEPGGNTLSHQTLSAAMSHAVGTIREEEDRLGVPHHLVSVQGNNWTSDISFYDSAPLAYDNVIYEVHGYPPDPSSYTFSHIPVIIGEYGSLNDASAFYADVEAKHIPNLAWDFEPYSDCSPDLLDANQSDSNLVPTAWGSTVQAYLLAH